ncbi:Flp pilus assembly protein TadD, contains TPR repeats [Palleronia marisminoris]|uniref:Lipoprotein NlpI n=1 Tax=Palleronia marisminoris TaxID=315423 RepID=A0A1Y5T177_9RHOB|nr:tetratricopeptide repeat protein [Palleronia marisminoris]SFH13669.1 Flp pilus assembly protein TadD, contains TPR repeats [Palleronia marisminoris]SLN53663.1 lipoprotein NlpI [Palleronia marisminoris]
MFRTAILAAGLAGLALPGVAEPDAGAYLAGRSAQLADDFSAAERYLSQALTRDGDNLALMESLAGAQMSLLDFDRAATVAERLVENGGSSQIAALAVLSARAGNEDWQGILDALDEGLTVGPLFDGLARAWSLMGLDRTEDALAAFDEVSGEQGVEAFGIYHKALALASLDRFEEAAEVLETNDGIRLTRRGLMAEAQILSQVGRADEARALLQDEAGSALDATLSATFDALADGEPVEFTVAPDARAGMAELAFDIANTVVGETASSYALLYSRMAEFLRPSHTHATLLSALLFEEMGQHGLAISTYGNVPADDPAFFTAELGRAEALRAEGQSDAGVEVMQELAAQYDDQPLVHITLGDALREDGRYEEARAAYDEAIALLDEAQSGEWIVYFARAITAERLDDWEAAKADFETALELNPDQPQVLNYLGYSMLERGDDLEEALDMIERAVAAAPNSGAIVDSLGWGLYRAGRYEEAVDPMERAVELMPVDPVVNDHLGDVLWAVGRKLEARFQWQRALSFMDEDTEDVDPERVRRKIEVGLDRVLDEEGEPPLMMANGG